MKKLTLDETWRLCLSMWRWIAKQWKLGRRDVFDLKLEWLEKHGYKDQEIHENCFFCHAAPANCPACPGRVIDSAFNCHNLTWNTDPVAFLKVLEVLNRKRLAKKRK